MTGIHQFFVLALLCFPLIQSEDDYADNYMTRFSDSDFPLKQRPLRPQLISASRISPNQMVGLSPRYLRKPRKRHIKPEYLRSLLGDAFDPQWMSIEQPENASKIEITILDQTSTSWVVRRLEEQFNRLNLTAELEAAVSGPLLNSPELKKTIREWLFHKSFCPVQFTWEDVGPLFWPRWLRLGECVDRNGACSWPPGMHCVPAASTTVQLLRWHCQPRKMRRRQIGKRQTQSGKKRLKCSWLKVPYPVTTECFCTC